MTLLAAAHSPAGTFQRLAAASTSIMRAAAPPWRTYSCDSRMPRLPPVEKLRHTRLRATFWPGVGNSVETFDQSHSSSSATSWARPVSVPWPISERAMRITTRSSGWMTTQALISRTAPATCASALPNGMPKPSERPPAAALTRNERRSIEAIAVMARSSLRPWRRRGSPRALAGRCRSGRCSSSPRRCRRRSGWASRRAGRRPP